METICILCPKGCEVQLEVDGERVSVSGNACPKGADFAEQEWRHPKRTLCTTVMTDSDHLPRLPVKTSGQIPKESLFEVMGVVNAVRVHLPVSVGTCIVPNVLGLGVDIIATMSLEEV